MKKHYEELRKWLPHQPLFSLHYTCISSSHPPTTPVYHPIDPLCRTGPLSRSIITLQAHCSPKAFQGLTAVVAVVVLALWLNKAATFSHPSSLLATQNPMAPQLPLMHHPLSPSNKTSIRLLLPPLSLSHIRRLTLTPSQGRGNMYRISTIPLLGAPL